MKIIGILCFIFSVVVFSYFQFKEDNSLSEHVHNVSDIPEKSIEDSFQKELLSSVDEGVESKAVNRNEIMRVSRELELCSSSSINGWQEIRALRDDLMSNITKRYNSDKLRYALIVLGNLGVLNNQTMTEIFEKSLINSWDKANPVISHYDLEKDENNIKFFREYIELSDLLDTDDLTGIKEWVAKNKHFLNTKLKVNLRGKEVYHSVAELMSKHLGVLSENTIDWVITNINFDVNSIAEAIKSKISLNLLKLY
jgi:hypothetical protein